MGIDTNNATTIRLSIEHVYDDDPDLSWLEQTDDEMGEGWEAHATQRLQEYGDGCWHMIGIRAKANIITPDGTVVEITSPGLWGVESDSDHNYLREIEAEQLDDLKAIMHDLGAVGATIASATLDDCYREDS